MDFVDERAVREALSFRFPGITVLAVQETGSTNTDLIEAYASGERTGITVLTALRQVRGRGTHGRVWSGVKESMPFSIALPTPAPRYLPPVPLLAGFSMAAAFRQAGVPVSVKWPNDLWLPHGKMGGILTEAVKTPSGNAVVIGTGINLELEPGARQGASYPAAALEDALGGEDPAHLRTQWLSRLSEAVLLEVSAYFKTLAMPDWSRWKGLGFLDGKRIAADNNAGEVLRGRCAGIDRNGALLLEEEDGTLRRIVSASIRAEE